MQEIYEVRQDHIESLTDVLAALQKAAFAHAKDLDLDFPRMLNEFGLLWMIVRAHLCMKRMPKGEVKIQTWLRQAKSAVSNRDFSIFEGDEEIGQAVQSWVLVDAEARTLVNMKTVAPMWNLPIRHPERTYAPKRLTMPNLPDVETWTVQDSEIDLNGHMNNVHYIRHAEKFAPEGALSFDIFYDHECFAGETLTLQAADGYVCGIKPDGTTAFRVHFYEGEPL